jgi:hypothetical protein
MKRLSWFVLTVALLCLLAQLLPQSTAPQPAGATPAKKSTAPAKSAAAAMTNQDVIKLVKAKVPEDLIVAKIKQSKTRFDTSVDGMVALKEAGVSDSLLAVMMNPGTPTSGSSSSPPAASAAPPPPPPAAQPAAKPSGPASNATKAAAPTVTVSAPRKTPKPVEITQAPANYGVYIEQDGQLKPLGRIQTKVQVSKFRSLLKSMVPFVRQKIDINVPGAHSTSRFEAVRPNFYAFFPPSRDVSKFKLLQCKITGQKFDQRTLANASILFSTEQNQDEVLCDIGPTSVRDLYRISPREDIPTGEFGFVEGNTGSKSSSNIEILDVYDFGIDRKEEKMGLVDYLATLPPVTPGDRAYLELTKEECQKTVADHAGKVGITGSLMGWFDRQYSSLDVYWADPEFARAFARLEMLDKNLSPDQTHKLTSLLLSSDNSQYYLLVSIGGKIGSGKLIGANEGERLMRPFDASLTDEKGKDIVPAKHLEFIGGYAGLWKVTFDQKSIRGPLIQSGTPELVFEARLNQNLDFKAKFPIDKIKAGTAQ